MDKIIPGLVKRCGFFLNLGSKILIFFFSSEIIVGLSETSEDFPLPSSNKDS